MATLRVPTRAAHLVLTRRLKQRRFASQSSPNHHAGDETTQYPRETFTGPFWRNTALIALGGYLLINYGPSDLLFGSVEEDGHYKAPWLTRLLEHYGPPIQEWMRWNEEQLSKVKDIAQETLLVQTAKPSPVVRLTHRRPFEQISPHGVPVGALKDISDGVLIRPNSGVLPE